MELFVDNFTDVDLEKYCNWFLKSSDETQDYVLHGILFGVFKNSNINYFAYHERITKFLKGINMNRFDKDILKMFESNVRLLTPKQFTYVYNVLFPYCKFDNIKKPILSVNSGTLQNLDIEHNMMFIWACKNNHTVCSYDIVHMPNCSICNCVMTKNSMQKYTFTCTDTTFKYGHDSYTWEEYGISSSKCSLCKKPVFAQYSSGNANTTSATKEECKIICEKNSLQVVDKSSSIRQIIEQYIESLEYLVNNPKYILFNKLQIARHLILENPNTHKQTYHFKENMLTGENLIEQRIINHQKYKELIDDFYRQFIKYQTVDFTGEFKDFVFISTEELQ
jgi:hypothetical protein